MLGPILGPVNKGTLYQLRWPYANRPLTELEQTIFDANGTLPSGVGLDPTTVVLDFEAPGSSVTTVDYPTSGIVRLALGVYYYLLDTTAAAGVWNLRAYSTGTGQAAYEAQLIVVANFPGPEV